MKNQISVHQFSRRQFLRRSTLAVAGASAAAHLPSVLTLHAAPDTPIKIGVIGCGGRGTGAALNALGAATKVIYPAAGYHTEDVDQAGPVNRKDIQIVALADVFEDRLNRCRDNLGRIGINIPKELCFTGFEGYQKLLAVPDINYVILATPPHFRPAHLKAAIEAGKHVFMEKPVAVDGPGVRLVMEAGDLAKKKGLGIAAGTQRRHQKSYQEAVKRLQDGAIGEILCARAYWLGGEIWVVEREPGWSDMEWQLRNWNYFTWLSGDHIVEQHVHNLDVVNWVLGTHPIRATFGLGGRQVRTSPKCGHINDHFAVEYDYPNNVKVFSYSRQINGCDGKVEEAVVGAKGTSNCHNWIKPAAGELWRFRDKDSNPYEQEHQDLIASIRAGQPINEARAVAESTLTAIIGREAVYSGKAVEWEAMLKSQVRLGPSQYAFGPLPVADVAMPGKTKPAI